MSGILVRTGHVANEPEPADRLRRLQEEARMRRVIYEAHRCHGCEIDLAKADQAVADFLEQHPELGS